MFKKAAKKTVNYLVKRPAVSRVVRYAYSQVTASEPDYLRVEVRKAEALGLYIGDYLERVLGGVSPRAFVDPYLLPRLQPDSRVVEIGPGTGRFSLLVQKAIPKGRLHLFETDLYWKHFLATRLFVNSPNVVVHDCDGHHLTGIEDGSVDLVYAKGVFTYLSSLVCFSYLQEAARVLRSGGSLVFNFHDLDNKECALSFISASIEPHPGPWKFNSLTLIQGFLEARGLFLEGILELRQDSTARVVAFGKRA